MNEICDLLGSAGEDEMDALMEELGTIQDELTLHDFYVIDAKVEEVARALGLLDLGLDRDVTDLSGGQRTKVLLGNFFWKNRISFFWTSLPIIWTKNILHG